ncbi:Crp/Fnr family transcriptional regulator [Bacteroides sp.]|uniref:Crp/Fnr family transcriptional regulator n=1 Tax=Bacteroides sp. TaxID=29523 RepID=UPI003D0DB7DA
MHSKLIDTIADFIPLDSSDIDLVQSLFKCQKVSKGVTLIETGQHSDRAFFINEGYLKYSKIIESGEELIIHLYTPLHFATSLNSFFLGQKSEEDLHTITDCDLLCITHSDLEYLYSTSPKWQSFGRKLMESFLIEKEERIIDQLSLTAQMRYSKLLKCYPEIIQNVPVKYIASYIGIQPESLSRIRKKN